VLSAPAASLIGARPGGYWRVQGTSFAAPLVTATAALVRARLPRLDAANVINHLISTASDLGAPGRDDRYGFGLVDPLAAMTTRLPEVAANPLTDVRSLAQAATGNEPKNGWGGVPGAPGAAGPAGAGDQATDASNPSTEPFSRAAGRSTHRTTFVTMAGVLGAPLLALALLLGAAYADRRGYLRRYRRSPRHLR
jgi:subtilisin family serine protease